MQVGCLGDVIFEVSSETIKTLDGFSWNSGAKWNSSERIGKEPLLDFGGPETDNISFSIILSKALGVDPMKEIELLFFYERNGSTLPLIIGTHKYGSYRWVISKTQRTATRFDASGDLHSITVNLSLLAYPER